MENGHDLGRVVTVNGTGANARLFKTTAAMIADGGGLTIGRLVGILVDKSLVVGVVVSMSISMPDPGDEEGGHLVAAVDFMGEIERYGTERAAFQRGVTMYPTIGNVIRRLQTVDLAIIHHIEGGDTIEVGRLRLDASVPALINFDDLLRKHFAVLGTTGVGKSTSVALILQEILKKKANLRILLVDPHNEYANCFGELAHVINPKSLLLPYWLFNFEEIVDVFFRGRPGVEEETEILAELIPIAKARYAANARGERVQVRKTTGAGFTADTPVPYRISELVNLINDAMGKLENRSGWPKYHRLVTRIETLGNDSRYAFMFSNLFVEDMMVQVLEDLFRLPINGKPITVLQLAGLPAEVVDFGGVGGLPDGFRVRRVERRLGTASGMLRGGPSLRPRRPQAGLRADPQGAVAHRQGRPQIQRLPRGHYPASVRSRCDDPLPVLDRFRHAHGQRPRPGDRPLRGAGRRRQPDRLPAVACHA